MMLRETGAGVAGETMQKNLSKDREYERILQQLKEEFSRIDLNRDGTITLDEIVRFLNEQTNGTVDTAIAEQIFMEIDEDGSGTIPMEEFVFSYFEKQRQVKERIQQLEEDVKTHQEAREKLVGKLKETRQRERLNNYGLDEDAILSVRVVEARDLKPMDITGKSDPYCVLRFTNQTQKSNYIKQELNPVWNEVFTFDVETGKETMEITVFDKDDFGSDDFEGRCEFDLDEFKDQAPHDVWLDLEAENPAVAWQGKIRLVIQYVFSKTKMLTGYINMWSEQIENEEAEMKDLKQVLKHMESPFGFIQGFQMQQRVKSRAEERLKEAEEHKQEALTNWELPPQIAARMEAVEKTEKAVEAKIDIVANNFAQKAGYGSVPWFMLTWWLLWLYTGLTCLVMFMREDFFNLTICATALYMMFNTDRITKGRFRMLVLGIFITLLYDGFWFYMKHTEYSTEPKTDGSGEVRVRRFSLMMSYASFLLRVRIFEQISFSFLWRSCFGRTRWTSLRSSRTRSR